MLSKDFREFVESLNASSARYLVVGGYAVALHGHPRYTKDLDVWVDSTVDNARNVINGLVAFGFGSLDIEIDDLIDENNLIQLGYPPNRIDLITTLKGLEFGDCFEKKFRSIFRVSL